jgi:hypothetical protein
MSKVINEITIFTKVNLERNDIDFLQKKVNFEDNNELRNVRLWGVQTYYKYKYFKTPELIIYESGQFINDPDYNLPLITKKFFQQSFLNLYDINNVNFLKNAPLPIFQTIENSQNESFIPNKVDRASTIVEKDHKIFTGQLFDLQNSSVTLIYPDNDFPDPLTFIVPITFYYSRLEQDSKLLIKK